MMSEPLGERHDVPGRLPDDFVSSPDHQLLYHFSGGKRAPIKYLSRVNFRLNKGSGPARS